MTTVAALTALPFRYWVILIVVDRGEYRHTLFSTSHIFKGEVCCAQICEVKQDLTQIEMLIYRRKFIKVH